MAEYRTKSARIALVALLLLFPAIARADVTQLAESEFRELASTLAQRVNLFHDAWEKDPNAVFYGGTSRDFLYWLKGKFKNANSRQEAEAVRMQLLQKPVIGVKEFLVGESDIDIVTGSNATLDPADYGVRKIDKLGPEIFDPSSEAGRNERAQGYIPAEKIRLSKEGFAAPGEFGDGLHEIYSGHLTVSFASAKDFAKGTYAKKKLNHPILLALRFLRLQAMDYFQTHGKELPNAEELLSRVDPETDKKLRQVIDQALQKNELKPYLEQHQFVSWLNGTLQKMFRSYTNPDAAMELVKAYGIDRLPLMYSDVKPLNQFLFQKQRDPKAIERAMKKYGVKEKAFFKPASQLFPDGYLYHGTKKEEWFRTILFQGILPSEGGSGGAGLYGVSKANQEFAERWGGDSQRLIKLPISPDAKIVDITRGEGARVWKEFNKGKGKENFEKFADAFGADALRYPYGMEAFVVKNSAILGAPKGVYRELLPLSELTEKLRGEKDPLKLFRQMEINLLNRKEQRMILENAPLARKKLAQLSETSSGISRIIAQDDRRLTEAALEEMAGEPITGEYEDLFRAVSNALKNGGKGKSSGGKAARMVRLVTALNPYPRELLRFIESSFKDFPQGSKEVDRALLDVIKKVLSGGSTSQIDFAAMYPAVIDRKWAEPSAAKKIFKEILLNNERGGSYGSAPAVFALNRIGVTQAELEKLKQGSEYLKRHSQLMPLLDFDPAKASARDVDDLLEVYFGSADNELAGERTEVIQLITRSSPKVRAMIESRLIEVLKASSPPKQVASEEVDGLIRAARGVEMRKLSEILHGVPKLVSPQLQEEMLDYLERMPKKSEVRFALTEPTAVFPFFDLNNPEIAARIQKLYVDGRLQASVYEESNVLDLAEALPEMQPKFVDLVGKAVKTSEYRPNWHGPVDFKVRWAALLKRSAAAPRQGRACAEAFLKLSP